MERKKNQRRDEKWNQNRINGINRRNNMNNFPN